MKQNRYSEDQVKSVLDMRKNGFGIREIARHLNMSASAISNFYHRKELTDDERKLFMINR